MVHPYGMIERPNQFGLPRDFPDGKEDSSIFNLNENILLTSDQHKTKTNNFASRREATIGNPTK